jgi:2-C-methyl-D-erythritol 4-phosphate cytidylyltransferase
MPTNDEGANGQDGSRSAGYLALIVTAAGSSSRMGGSVKKEYLTINDGGTDTVSVLSSALRAFLSTGLFSDIAITVPAGGEAEACALLERDGAIGALLCANRTRPIVFAEGGPSRQESVRKGLERLAASIAEEGRPLPSIVLVHDGARPWVTERTIRLVADLAARRGAAIPGVNPVDTQKEIDADGKIIRHLDRSRILAVQTPQGFRFADLLEAHRKAAGDGRTYTDDAEIWGRYAGDAWVCEGDRENKKITYKDDLS